MRIRPAYHLFGFSRLIGIVQYLMTCIIRRDTNVYYKYFPAYNYFEEISKEDADKIMKESSEKKQSEDADTNSAKKKPKTGKTYAGWL